MAPPVRAQLHPVGRDESGEIAVSSGSIEIEEISASPLQATDNHTESIRVLHIVVVAEGLEKFFAGQRRALDDAVFQSEIDGISEVLNPSVLSTEFTDEVK